MDTTRYGDGSVRPVNETTRASRAPSVMLRDIKSGKQAPFDARLSCIKATPKYGVEDEITDEAVDRRDLVELADVLGGFVYLDDPLGGIWRRYEVVVPARQAR